MPIYKRGDIIYRENESGIRRGISVVLSEWLDTEVLICSRKGRLNDTRYYYFEQDRHWYISFNNIVKKLGHIKLPKRKSV